MLLLQGDVPTEDLILGAVILVILAPIIFGAGYLLGRFKNACFPRVWSPLIPVIQGAKVTGDGGGAATNWLTDVQGDGGAGQHDAGRRAIHRENPATG